MVVTGAWLVNVPTLTSMAIPENSKSKSCLQHPPEGSCCDFQPRSAQDIPHGILHSGQQAMLSVSPFSAQANTLVRRSPACVPGANGLNGATDRGLTTDQPSPRDQLILTIQLVTFIFSCLAICIIIVSVLQDQYNCHPIKPDKAKYFQNCCCTDCLPQGFFQFLFLLFQIAVLC